MASTSKQKVPVLPRGWSQHESKSNPGRMYYFNEMTGARTWDIRDIVSRDSLPQTSVTSDINSLSVSQLEQLLEQRKKEEAETNLLKRKTSINPSEPSKRAKIVFDPSKDIVKKIEKNPTVTSQRLLENRTRSSSRSKPQVATPSPSRHKKVDRSNNSENSEESLVLDEDELQELKKIKKKHKSPPKPKPKESPKTAPRLRPKVSPKKSRASPEPGWSPSPKPSPNNSNEMIPRLVTLETTVSQLSHNDLDPSVTKKNSFDKKDFRTKYVNYENEEKLSYHRKPTQNVPVRPQTSQSSAPRHLMTEQPRAVDVTPDNECDVTPVFGSLEESDDLECGDEASNFCLKKTTDNMFDHLRRLIAEEKQEPPLPEPEPTKNEEQSVDNSYEVARPPSPTLLPIVQELEEEENMDWETVDMDEVLIETQRVRSQVCQDMDCDHGDHEHSSDDTVNKNTKVTGTMVVVDTNVLISNIVTVNRLLQLGNVLVGVPWMVVQELDKLKVSETSKTAVGARAGVRWLQQALLTNNINLWTETSAQSRQAAAKFESKSPDDRILATCLQKCEEDYRVVLLTNDVNLSNKAIINHVQSGPADNIMDIVKNKEEVNVFNDVQDEEFNYDVIRDLVDQLRDYLRDLLEGVLRKEFLETYGDQMWEKIISIKPRPQRPFWTLSQLFTLFSKHHQAVFGLNYPKNGHELKSRLASVKDLVGFKKVFKRYREVTVLLAEMEKLVQVIKQKDDYDGLVSICNEKLVEVSNQVKVIEQESKNHVRTIVNNVDNEDGRVQAQALFQQVWEIIAAFTRGFANFLGVTNNIEQFEPNIIFHSKADVIKELPPFLSTVSSLQEAMDKAVNIEDDINLNSFYDLLTNFRSNIEFNLSHWPPSESTVSRKNLFNFIRRENELVKNGLIQLGVFRQVLINCIYDNNSHL